MAWNRRSSLLEDLMELASKLPAWLSLGIALLSYLVLHHFASKPVQVAAKPGGVLPTNMTEILFHPLITVMQYAIPLAFVLGVAVSGLKAYRGRKLAKEYVATPTATKSFTQAARSPRPTDEMSWKGNPPEKERCPKVEFSVS